MAWSSALRIPGKSFTLRHASRWNRTNSPVIKSHRLPCRAAKQELLCYLGAAMRAQPRQSENSKSSVFVRSALLKSAGFSSHFLACRRSEKVYRLGRRLFYARIQRFSALCIRTAASRSESTFFCNPCDCDIPGAVIDQILHNEEPDNSDVLEKCGIPTLSSSPIRSIRALRGGQSKLRRFPRRKQSPPENSAGFANLKF